MKRALSAVLMLLIVLTACMPSMSVIAQESTPEVSSQPSRGIAFYPEETGSGTFIDVEVQPGTSTTVNIVIGNVGDIDQILRTYAVSALTGVGGGFVLAEYGTEPDEQTSWLDYKEAEYTFAPTEGISVPVTITVPEGMAPGEYVTGLAAEQKDAFEVPGSDMMVQRVRWSIPVKITVPGERQSAFEFMDATLENNDGVLVATIGIANTGNVIVRAEGEVRLLDAEGNIVGVADVKLESVYTGTETTFAAAWANVPLSESYSVEILMTAEDGTVKVNGLTENLVPSISDPEATPVSDPLTFSTAEMTALTKDTPPSTLQFEGAITNNGTLIEQARVSIVTYKDGEEVDRYPIMQAVTIEQGTTPVEARYSLPGGFTEGTYTFEVTIELGDAGTQTVLVTQPIDFEIVVP